AAAPGGTAGRLIRLNARRQHRVCNGVLPPFPRRTAMYKRILIATDGSELAGKGLQKGLELAAQLGAAVDIVTVSEPWAVGMYDAMGWSAGYEASAEYKQDREA